MKSGLDATPLFLQVDMLRKFRLPKYNGFSVSRTVLMVKLFGQENNNSNSQNFLHCNMNNLDELFKSVSLNRI